MYTVNCICEESSGGGRRRARDTRPALMGAMHVLSAMQLCLLPTRALHISGHVTPPLTTACRAGSPLMASLPCPLTALRDACPLTARRSSDDTTNGGGGGSSDGVGLVEGVSKVIDDVEGRLGLSRPLACTAAETAIETLVRSASDEIGSLDVSIDAASSAGLLLRGQLLSARVEATAVSALGIRASSISLRSDGLDVDIGSPLDNRPPNLRSATAISYGLRLSTDDLNGSPLIFGALQEILRELIRSGASAAIGETLPIRDGTLRVNLVKAEPPVKGRLVLVADAEVVQSDGRVVTLQGMRVRCTPRASGRMLVLDAPELISTFEGFGAKLEVGLPFLRGAGVPLPDGLRLNALRVEDGAVSADGTIEIRPLDYDELARELNDLAAAAAAAQRQQPPAPSAVAVDVDGGAFDVDATSEDDTPPGAPSRGALPGY